jgi:hypothetical protein
VTAFTPHDFPLAAWILRAHKEFGGCTMQYQPQAPKEARYV